MSKKIVFSTYIKDFKVEEYFPDVESKIENNKLVVQTNLLESEISKLNKSQIDLSKDCVILFISRKEDMKELTLRDLYNLMIKNHEETNKKIEETNKKIDDVRTELKSDIEETNKKIDNVRSELKSDINEINNRLDIHENALKKAHLL